MSHHAEPSAWVVYESMFGNTEAVAHAVADGLREQGYDVTCADVSTARHAEALTADLLVVGAPTHAFSLSRVDSRADALLRGATTERPDVGLREWLTDLGPAPAEATAVAVFDTRASKVRRVPMSAGRSAARMLRRKGYPLHGRLEGFVVSDVCGPLVAGELTRAKTWGRELAETARTPQH
jgi:hypothetical protein